MIAYYPTIHHYRFSEPPEASQLTAAQRHRREEGRRVVAHVLEWEVQLGS